ncbi:dTMP kinase [Desulfovibrio piger]|uniref:Thymidylate kinase n=1 Tax=Desulfovibrio piger TaxID=901 RepID=A0A848C8H0_9BACT|nr:dTMP kinase [Desulfovibrio piger]NME52581.1 thymidylate kinase [Desulfovibrio piger]
MSILTDKVGINVLLEGVDGAGKSTVANLLVDKFAEHGFEAIIVKAPDERFRDLLSRNSFSRPGKVLLYAADMLESCKNIVVPHLREGKVVIQDRSVLSTFVYQRLIDLEGGDDLESSVLREILDCVNDLMMQSESGIRAAVLVALLDVPARVAMKRSAAHAKDEYEEAEFEEWARRVRCYRALSDTVDGFRVDAMRLSADEVADSILEEVLRRYHMMTANSTGNNDTSKNDTGNNDTGNNDTGNNDICRPEGDA